MLAKGYVGKGYVGKTKFACFHTAQQIVAYPELKINNIIIDRVTECNFLGLISSNMKWNVTNYHASKVLISLGTSDVFFITTKSTFCYLKTITFTVCL